MAASATTITTLDASRGTQPKSASRSELSEAIVEMLKKSLEEIGGPSVRDSVMYYLRERYGVSFERISENPTTLVSALRDIFGIGESLVESKISKKLSELLKLPEKPSTIGEAIKLAKKSEREKRATF